MPQDTRIVEMRFENAQFEKNIAKSTKSLEELKEAMNIEETSKGLEKFSDGLNGLRFNGLENNLQRLADKFTGLGDAGEYVISRIRASLESAAQSVERFIKSLSTDQISVGQGKYDALTKSVQTIVAGGKNTEEQAYNVMSRVMAYTDQTSHSFNTMVGQIASLTSTGMGLQEAEYLLEGIANASTKAGGSADQAATAMSVLSKAIGGNHLGYQQFLTLSQTARVVTEEWREKLIEAGIAAKDLEEKNGKIFTAKKYGKQMEVTAKNLENTLSKKWASADTLKGMYQMYQFGLEGKDGDPYYYLKHPEEALDSFGKTAYLTGQRALTLVDAFNSWKESVSSGWMESFQHIFGNLSESMEHFTDLADGLLDTLERFKTWRNTILRQWGDSGGRQTLWDIILGSYKTDAEEGAYGLLDTIHDVSDIVSNAFWDFMRLFAEPDIASDVVWNDPGAKESWLGKKLRDFGEQIKGFGQKIHDFFYKEINLSTGGTTTRFEQIRDTLKIILGIAKIAWDVLSGLFSFVRSITEQLDPSFQSILTFLSELGVSIYDTAGEAKTGDAIRQFFNDLAEKARPVTQSINNLTESITGLFLKIAEWADKSGAFKTVMDFLSGSIQTFADIISKVISPINDFIASIIDAVGVLFEGNFSEDSIREAGARLGTSMNLLLKSLVDALPDDWKFLTDWLKDLFGLWDDEVKNQNPETTFGQIRLFFQNGFGGLFDFIQSLLGGFDLNKALETGFGFGAAYNFLATVIGWFKNVNLYQVIMTFLGAATVFGLFRLISNAKKISYQVIGFFDDIGGSFRNIKSGLLGEYEWFSERFLRIAESIGIIVACVVAIGSMNTTHLIQGILGLVGVIGIMVVACNLLNRIKAKYVDQYAVVGIAFAMAATITMMSIAIGALMVAMTPLAMTGWGGFVRSMLSFIIILGALGVFMTLMIDKMDTLAFSIGGANTWSGIGKIAAIMLVISGSIALLAAGIGSLMIAMTPLAVTGWNGVLPVLVGFIGILAALGVFMKVMLNVMDEFAFKMGGGMTSMASIGKMAAMMFTLAGSISLLAVGIGILTMALVPLAIAGWDRMAVMMAGLTVILFEIGAFVKYISSISTMEKGATAKIAGLAGFAFGIGILVMALTPLALMDWGPWGRALLGLAIVLGELVGFMEVIKVLHLDNTYILGLAGFAFSIGILMLALVPLSNMSWEGWVKSLVGLMLVLGMMIGFMEVINVLKLDSVKIAGIAAFAFGIGLIMLSLIPLSNMSTQGYFQAIFGLAAVLIEIVAIMAIIKEIQPNLSSSAAAFVAMIGLALTMVLFSVALKNIENVDWGVILAFSAGLAVLLGAMGGVISILSKIGIGSGLKGILLMSLGLAAIVGIVSAMAPLLIGSIGDSLANMAGKLAIVSGLVKDFTTRMNGVGAGDIDSAQSKFDQIKELMRSLIGFSGLSSSIDAFSTCMWELGVAMELFHDHASAAGDLTKSPAMTFIRELLKERGGLREISTISLSKLQTNISGLGGAMMLYAKGANDVAKSEGIGENGEIDDKYVSSAVAILQKISEALVQNGGFTIPDNMPSEEQIGLFGVQLAALAGALVQFEESGKGLGDGTEQALATLDFFSQLKTKLEESNYTENMKAVAEYMNAASADSENMVNGNPEAIIEPSVDVLTQFGYHIEAIGKAMAGFAKSTSNVNTVTGEMTPIDFSNATSALQTFADIKAKLPEVGGVLTWIKGRQQNLGDMGSEIEALGQSLNDFSNKLKGEDGKAFDSTLVGSAIDAMDQMIGFMQQMQKKLNTIGGLKNFFSTLWEGREINLEDLGTQVGKLGDGLKTLGLALDEGHWDKKTTGVDQAFSALDHLMSIMLKLEQMSGLTNSAYANLDKLGYFVAGLTEVTDVYAPNKKSIVQNIVEFIDQLNTAMIQIDDAVGEETMQNLQDRMSIFATFAKGLNDLTNVDVSIDWTFIGTKLSGDLVSGIGEGTEAVVTALSTMMLNAYTGAQTAEGVDWNTLGTNISSGVALGISSGASLAIQAAVNMAARAYAAAKAELRSRSPSRVFMELGGYVSEGMAIGISNGVSGVEASSTEMGEVAIDQAGGIIATLSRIMSEDIDSNPTITPVLDLSNINAGIATMNGLFGGTSIGLDNSGTARYASVALPSHEGEAHYQNGTDLSGLYTRVDTMSQRISDLGTKIANMKIYLDGRTVAGGISTDVDLNIGRKQFYAGRRN